MWNGRTIIEARFLFPTFDPGIWEKIFWENSFGDFI